MKFTFSIILVVFFATAESKRLKLSCKQIRDFVDGHNIRRQKIAHNLVEGQPSASNMLYMVWDEELAEKAGHWAENGIFIHNPDKSIGSQKWKMTGENIYMSEYTSNEEYEDIIPNIEEALDSWFGENEMYDFKPITHETVKPVGHYTQMVWAETSHIGCGISQRKESDTTTTMFVCDYGPSGNFVGKYPYKVSSQRGHLLCMKGACDKPYGKYC